MVTAVRIVPKGFYRNCFSSDQASIVMLDRRVTLCIYLQCIEKPHTAIPFCMRRNWCFLFSYSNTKSFSDEANGYLLSSWIVGFASPYVGLFLGKCCHVGGVGRRERGMGERECDKEALREIPYICV